MTKLYRFLLSLYPSDFRSEFGEEMQDVFVTALTEVSQLEQKKPVVIVLA